MITDKLLFIVVKRLSMRIIKADSIPVLNFIFFFCEMENENDKTVQLRDFLLLLFFIYLIRDRSVFSLHNNHEIEPIRFHVCLMKASKSENKLL